MLTPKQENFCIAYLETGNASEAYRRSYNCANMKPESINRLAKALIDNVNITSRIESLRAPVIAKAQITYEGHIAELESLRELAKQAGQFSAAIKAEENRGKVAGLYIEKKEITGKDGASLGIEVIFDKN